MAEKVKKKRKLDALGIALRILLVVAAALLCVLLVLSWDSIREKGFYATFFGESAAEEGEIVRAQELDFAANQKNAFAAYRGGLAVLSPSGLEIIAPDGETELDVSKSFSRPALAVCGDRLVAYDAGGVNMLYIEKGKLASSEPSAGEIITAAVNSSGWRLVISRESGWKAVASVVKSSGEQVYALKSAERYLTGGDVSPDCTRVALGGVRQSDAEIISSVYIFEFSSEEPIAFWEGSLGAPVDVKFLDDGRIAALFEGTAVFIDGDTGEELGRCDFGAKSLKRFAVGGDFAALALEDGSGAVVLTLSFDGKELARRGLAEVVDLSAGGEYLGVLTSDSVLVYNNYLENAAAGDAPSGGRRILLAGGKTAYILGTNRASLYEF